MFEILTALAALSALALLAAIGLVLSDVMIGLWLRLVLGNLRESFDDSLQRSIQELVSAEMSHMTVPAEMIQ